GRAGERRNEDRHSLGEQQVAEPACGPAVAPQQSSPRERENVRDEDGRERRGVCHHSAGRDDCDCRGGSGQSDCSSVESGGAQGRPERGVARPDLDVEQVEIEFTTDGRPNQGDASTSPFPVAASTRFSQTRVPAHLTIPPVWERLKEACTTPESAANILEDG